MMYYSDMKKFYYSAIKDRKEVVSGYVEAQTPAEAKEKVFALGFIPSKIHEEDFGTDEKIVKEKATVNHISLSDKIQFTSELQMLFQSGISPIEALETLGKHAPSKTISRLSYDLCDRIKRGATFSEALSAYQKPFGTTYLSLAETGEVSGSLPQTLKYLVNLMRKQDDLKGKYIQMLIYPSILVLALVGIFFVFGGFVLPKMIEMCNISPSDVPPMAAGLIQSVEFVQNYWFMLLIACGCGIYGLMLLGGLQSFMNAISKVLTKIPALGTCMQYMTLSHYMSVLQVSYDAGVPIHKCLLLAENTVSNETLKNKAKAVFTLVQNGSELADAFMTSGFLPPIFMSLIATGEKTGKLGTMFRDIALGVEQKLDMAIGALSKLFEPALLVVIGIAVAYLIICFFQMYAAAFGTLM